MIALNLKAEGLINMTHVADEIWLPITGTGGLYEVSNLGGVRRTQPLRPLKPSNDGKGYARVNLSVGGKVTLRYIAHLVAEEFIGPRPSGHEVRHLNGDTSNNALANLAYGTKADNMQDALRHGTFPVLERRPGAKLTREDVTAIFQSTESPQQLASIYSVGAGVIRQIKLRQTWASITEGLPDAAWNAKPKHPESIVQIAIDRTLTRERASELTGLSLHQIKRLRRLNS